MNILITGGSGFIGRHVVANCRRRGHNVMIYDLVAPAFDGAIYCSGDIRQPAKLRSCIEQCDGVIHLAGVLGTAETLADPADSVTTNVLGSFNVFEACRSTNETGSVNVFEACRRAEKPCVYIAVGNHFMLNPYSITKTTAEKLALMFNREYGTRIAVVRGLNAYGPYQKHKPVRKVIPNFILPALRDEPLIVYGSGDQIMDFIYVEDIAEILCRALFDNHKCYHDIIEAGSGRRTTISYIAETVIRLAESGSQILHHAMRAGEEPDSIVLADVRTLASLNYNISQMVDIEEGLRRTIRFYRENLRSYQ